MMMAARTSTCYEHDAAAHHQTQNLSHTNTYILLHDRQSKRFHRKAECAQQLPAPHLPNLMLMHHENVHMELAPRLSPFRTTEKA